MGGTGEVIDDQTFLALLEKQWSDPAFQELFERHESREDNVARRERSQAELLRLPGADVNQLEEAYEYIAKTVAERGIGADADQRALVGLAARSALSLLDHDTVRVAQFVQVGAAWLKTINARTVLTPRGNAVILLDTGMTWWIPMVARGFWAVQYGSRDERLITPGLGLLTLCVCFVIDQSIDTFRNALTGHMFLKDISDHERMISEAHTEGDGLHYVTLHEYGHALLNHAHRLVDTAPNEHKSFRLTLELEADEFAFRALAASRGVFGLVGPLLFMRLFAIAESIAPRSPASMHPSWEERIKRLRSIAGPDAVPLTGMVDVLIDAAAGDIEKWTRQYLNI